MSELRPGLVLVHGYGGSPAALEPLRAALSARWGDDAVTPVELREVPGSDGPRLPPFDEDGVVDAIGQAMAAHERAGRPLVLIGHSTGGTLALAAMARLPCRPRLLVLAATPRSIARGYAERWLRARSAPPADALRDLANLVRLIEAMGAQTWPAAFPLLGIH